MTLAGSSCAIISKGSTASPEFFKASFYEKFPTPPRTIDERADMVEFWCVNRPEYVADHPICDIEDADV